MEKSDRPELHATTDVDESVLERAAAMKHHVVSPRDDGREQPAGDAAFEERHPLPGHKGPAVRRHPTDD
ncbi:MAG: hypothetical protein LC792_12245 [Actinobacteria bacterium]|nr:hypothetical protein [Actinomycetota bacterium]